jgi:carboxypeptidase D
MSWPLGVDQMKPYFEDYSVQDALNIPNKKSFWTECSGSVYNALAEDTSPPAIELFPILLEQINIALF